MGFIEKYGLKVFWIPTSNVIYQFIVESSLDKNYSILFQHMDPKRDSIEADFLTNCAFWDMQMRSLARFSDFLGQVLD